ncbi:MAG: crossover junction endodeoxyribonuclease RuvC [Gemmatimonadales bacterium]
MKVLGIDPGTRGTGYGLVESADGELGLIECGVIRPPAAASLPERLREIQEGLADVIERTKPGCVVVEGVFYGQNSTRPPRSRRRWWAPEVPPRSRWPTWSPSTSGLRRLPSLRMPRTDARRLFAT